MLTPNASSKRVAKRHTTPAETRLPSLAESGFEPLQLEEHKSRDTTHSLTDKGCIRHDSSGSADSNAPLNRSSDKTTALRCDMQPLSVDSIPISFGQQNVSNSKADKAKRGSLSTLPLTMADSIANTHGHGWASPPDTNNSGVPLPTINPSDISISPIDTAGSLGMLQSADVKSDIDEVVASPQPRDRSTNVLDLPSYSSRSRLSRESLAHSLFKRFPKFTEKRRLERVHQYAQRRRSRAKSGFGVKMALHGGVSGVSENGTTGAPSAIVSTVGAQFVDPERTRSSRRVRWAGYLEIALEVVWILILIARVALFELPWHAFSSWVWAAQVLAHSLRLISFKSMQIRSATTQLRIMSMAYVLSVEMCLFHHIVAVTLNSYTADASPFFESTPRFGWRGMKSVQRLFIDSHAFYALQMMVNLTVLARHPSGRDIAIDSYLYDIQTRRFLSFVSRAVIPFVLTITYGVLFPPDEVYSHRNADETLSMTRLLPREVWLPVVLASIAFARLTEFVAATPVLLPCGPPQPRRRANGRSGSGDNGNEYFDKFSKDAPTPSQSRSHSTSVSVAVEYARPTR